MEFKLRHWQAQLGGQFFPGTEEVLFREVVYDTRTLLHPRESCFLALSSGQNDGHGFVADAYAAGVRNFIVKQIPEGHFEAASFWLVEAPLRSFQAMAAIRRMQWKGQVFGITGSNGKTVVKEWLNHFLESQYSVYRSPKSYNSQLGVPVSIWNAPGDQDISLLEAGISKPAEMELLRGLILPDMGILTHFGAQHDEGFSSRARKFAEKLKLFEGVAAIAASVPPEPYLEQLRIFCRDRNIALLLAGEEPGLDLCLELEESYAGYGKFRVDYDSERFHLETPFTDAASRENLALCLLVALHAGISINELQVLAPSLPPVEMRLKVLQGLNDCTLINDSYSMDFDSLVTAVDLLKNHEPGKPAIAILSDFPGNAPEELYRAAREKLYNAGVLSIIAIGQHWPAGVADKIYPGTADFLADMQTALFREQKILIKGARSFAFEQIVKALELRSHETVMEINLGAIAHNYRFFRSLVPPKVGIMAMVKASAYGSGSIEIASLLEKLGTDALGVAYPDEGIQLRKAGLKMPILVMNAGAAHIRLLARYKLAPVVYNMEMLQAILKDDFALRQMPGIHLEFDTGMHRLGFQPAKARELAAFLQQHPELKVLSVMTHLAGSDEARLDDYTHAQMQQFQGLADELEAALGYHPLRHVSNTSGILRFSQQEYDMVRLGIGLYGIDATGQYSQALQQAAGLYAVVTHTMDLKAGETVGYNRKGKLEKDTTVAVISIGYADGLNRALSNGKGAVLVNGQIAPILGNICMDMTMIDVGGMGVKPGDRVCIFGPERPVEIIAEELNTIPYEVLTSVSSRVPRIFWKE